MWEKEYLLVLGSGGFGVCFLLLSLAEHLRGQLPLLFAEDDRHQSRMHLLFGSFSLLMAFVCALLEFTDLLEAIKKFLTLAFPGGSPVVGILGLVLLILVCLGIPMIPFFVALAVWGNFTANPPLPFGKDVKYIYQGNIFERISLWPPRQRKTFWISEALSLFSHLLVLLMALAGAAHFWPSKFSWFLWFMVIFMFTMQVLTLVQTALLYRKWKGSPRDSSL